MSAWHVRASPATHALAKLVIDKVFCALSTCELQDVSLILDLRYREYLYMAQFRSRFTLERLLPDRIYVKYGESKKS